MTALSLKLKVQSHDLNYICDDNILILEDPSIQIKHIPYYYKYRPLTKQPILLHPAKSKDNAEQTSPQEEAHLKITK